MTMAKTKNKRPGKPRGMNYAFEKLRIRAETVSGRDIKYLHDDL